MKIRGNMEGCIEDRLEETWKDVLETNCWRPKGMQWRKIGGNMAGCRI